jgi:hypothetical protein
MTKPQRERMGFHELSGVANEQLRYLSHIGVRRYLNLGMIKAQLKAIAPKVKRGGDSVFGIA